MDLPQKTDRALLDKLILAARNYQMTPYERELQRRSYIRGEFMLEHPEMLAEEVDALLDKAIGQVSKPYLHVREKHTDLIHAINSRDGDNDVEDRLLNAQIHSLLS